MSVPSHDQATVLADRLHQLLADLAAMGAAGGPGSPDKLSQFVLGRLQRQTEIDSDPAQLVQRLTQWAQRGCTGWVETTAAIHELDGQGTLPEMQGRVLSADLAHPQGHGLRVRTAPGQQWTCTELRQAPPDNVQGDMVLLHEVRHASVRHPTERLVYRVASHLDAAGNVGVVDAWFIGFDTERAD